MILNKVISNFIICLILTVIIEAGFSFLLGVRTGYGQLIVLIVNVITNPILNSILTVVSFYMPRSFYYYFLIPLEILVVVAEGLIYKKSLPLKINPFIFSIILNSCSYFIGSGILKILF